MPLVTEDSALQPHQLAELLGAAFFSPSDDADSDSWETQRDRFDETALHLATRLLLSDDEACKTSIAEAVRRELVWLAPRDRTVDIRIRRPDVTVTAPAPPAPEPTPRSRCAPRPGPDPRRGAFVSRSHGRPLMPDTAISAAPGDTPPPMHPMDPRRGESLSPMFGAFLCWLLGLEPMTAPAITGISVAGKRHPGAEPGVDGAACRLRAPGRDPPRRPSVVEEE